MEIPAFEQRVLYEDNHLLVVNKANNILVQGDKTGDKTMLDVGKAYIKKKYDKPGNVFLGLVHRLDRPVSGVLVFARTSKALSRLNKQLRDQNIEKSYLVISANRPQAKKGLIENYLLKNTKKNVVSAHDKAVKSSKLASSRYELLASNSGNHLIRVWPKTGRSHQIRVHMSGIDCPILGDLKYGARYPLKDKSIALHCELMKIEHPVSKDIMEFRAAVPKTAHWKLWESFLK